MSTLAKSQIALSPLGQGRDALRRFLDERRAARAERRRIAGIEAELHALSDRDLADIGISRGRIHAVARGAGRG